MTNLNNKEQFNNNKNIKLKIQLKNNNINFYWSTEDKFYKFHLFITKDDSNISITNINNYNINYNYATLINTSESSGLFKKTITSKKYDPNNRYYIIGVYKNENNEDSYSISNIVPKNKKDVSDQIYYKSGEKFKQFPICLTDGSYKIVEGDKEPIIIEPNIKEQYYLDDLYNDLSKPIKNDYEINIL